MAKTMRNVVITAILLIVLAGGACWLVLTGGCSNINIAGFKPFAGAQVAATNTLIDVSGIKGRIESELYSRAKQISDQYGVPVEVLNAGIADLAIQEWEAVELPENANKTASYSVDAGGTQVDITTYDNPGVVTVGAYGMEATLGVPASAQPYEDLLPLLNYQDEIKTLSETDYQQILQLINENSG